MRISYSEKNVIFFGEKTTILSSQCSIFVDKIREIVRIKRRRDEP
jgi:hypothetical protein